MDEQNLSTNRQPPLNHDVHGRRRRPASDTIDIPSSARSTVDQRRINLFCTV